MGFVIDPGQLKSILLERQNYVVGGVDVILVGKPGSGKTTGLAQLAIENRKRHNDVIIWRGTEDCQWSFFLNVEPKIELVLWLQEGVEYKLINRKHENQDDPKKYFSEIKAFKNAKDLIDRVDRDKINIVETTPYTPLDPKQHIAFCRAWMEIFNELNHRVWSNPVSVFFDELEDLIPEGKGKDFWDVELTLSSIIRSLRKNYVSSFLACHSLEEIHWRIRKKIRWKIYMKGAKPEPGTRLTINTSKLNIGEAWIEGEQIEKFQFAPLGEEHMLRAIYNKII